MFLQRGENPKNGNMMYMSWYLRCFYPVSGVLEKVSGQPVVPDCPLKVKKQCGEGLFHQVLLAVLDDNSLIVFAYALSCHVV